LWLFLKAARATRQDADEAKGEAAAKGADGVWDVPFRSTGSALQIDIIVVWPEEPEASSR
jgi:hypothetical protein